MSDAKQTLSPAPNPQGYTDWHQAQGGLFLKINFFLAQYRSIVMIVLFAGGWIGLKTQGPGARITEVEQNQAVMMAKIAQQDSVIKVMSETARIMAMSQRRYERLQCFNTAYSTDQLDLAEIDCSFMSRRR